MQNLSIRDSSPPRTSRTDSSYKPDLALQPSKKCQKVTVTGSDLPAQAKEKITEHPSNVFQMPYNRDPTHKVIARNTKSRGRMRTKFSAKRKTCLNQPPFTSTFTSTVNRVSSSCTFYEPKFASALSSSTYNPVVFGVSAFATSQNNNNNKLATSLAQLGQYFFKPSRNEQEAMAPRLSQEVCNITLVCLGLLPPTCDSPIWMISQDNQLLLERSFSLTLLT